MNEELACVENALKAASVAVYKCVQGHVGWTGQDLLGNESAGRRGGKVNVSGDKVLAMDEIADELIEQALRACPLIAGFASEERDDFVAINEDGSYIVVYDPLDGSQNVPPGLSVGAIYGVFRAKSLAQVKKGDDIVAAGYAVFSSALQFAFCSRTEPVCLSQFCFERQEWIVFITDHKRPAKGKTYAINEGSCANWDATISTLVAQHLRGRSVRWMCSMVADVHRQLLQGGCFLYPCDKKYPDGRLRLVYEAVPLAFIWERAGKGLALANVDGQRILDVTIPKDVHARCGVIFLGENEAASFESVRKHAPLWNGGDKALKLEAVKHEQSDGITQEIKLLRLALAVGALGSIALLLIKK